MLKGECLGFFSFYERYSTLLHLPPLRFYCVGGCRVEPGTIANLALTARRSNHSARSHPFVLNVMRLHITTDNKIHVCEEAVLTNF